jgi:GrpB-like predicted nucleotidyltransferase (UPF0157 family)
MGTIRVVPYDPDWPSRFEAERVVLEQLLEQWLEGGVHHIGSTAIPEIAAKPIVDMMAGVRDLEAARDAYEPLATISYVSAPHRPGIAHHFSKPSGDEPRFGLHLTKPGSDLWRERLAFRDALRSDASLAREYESLKVRLAHHHPDDGPAYGRGKQPFVVRVLRFHGLELGRR